MTSWTETSLQRQKPKGPENGLQRPETGMELVNKAEQN